MPLSIISELGDLPAAQRGYFTRAQAAAAGVDDFELTRSVDRGLITRLDHGVYRERTSTEALETLRAFLMPVLTRKATGSWDPNQHRWE